MVDDETRQRIMDENERLHAASKARKEASGSVEKKDHPASPKVSILLWGCFDGT